jgi:predicted outer membrane repeat protein
MNKLSLISRSRALAFALTLVLAFSLAPLIGAQADGTGGAAYAAGRAAVDDPSGSWTDWTYYDISWYVDHENDSAFLIDNAAELAGLAALVNGTAQMTTDGALIGAKDFKGKTIYLATDGAFNLGAHYWTPIGGNGPSLQGVPNAPAFSGGFNGNVRVDQNMNKLSGPEITDMVIDPSILATGNEGFGLFGYVDGGSITNVKVSGTIESKNGAVDAAAASAIGGVVGYIYGNIQNAHSSVDINLPATTSNVSEIGGIAGVIENATGGSIYIKYSSSTGDLMGGSRTGGIAGAVYAVNDGGVMLQADFNTGDAATTITSSRSYIGGVVGYTRGQMMQCANTGNINSAGGHYVAGLAGIIQGANPQGNARYSFSAGDVTTVAAMQGYSQALYASVDNSTSMKLEALFWRNSAKTFGQATGSGWGDPDDVLPLSDSEMSGTEEIETTSHGTRFLEDILNSPQDGVFTSDSAISAGGIIVPAIEYVQDDPHPIDPLNPKNDKDPDDAVFVDGTLAVDGNGSKASPFNNYPEAAEAAAEAGKDLYVRGTITVTDFVNWDGPTEHTVYRSSILDGYVFDVMGKGELWLSSITIDGNAENTGYGSALIGVEENASLSLNNYATLQNNKAGSGGGVRVYGGNVTMHNNSKIVSCSAIANAGAIAVYTDESGSPSATFTMNGGTMSGNSAGNNGGAVYSQKGSVFTLAGGTITNNKALFGNGIYVSANGNPANPAELTISPSAALTFGSSDNIYLPAGVVFKVTETLSSNIYVTCEDPIVNRLVAIIGDSGIANGSIGYFNYFNGTHTFDVDFDDNIVLAS